MQKYGVKITFQVFARNQFGNGTPAHVDAETSYTPSAPTRLEIIDSTVEQLTLSWRAPDTDNGARIFEYSLEVREYPDGEWRHVSSVDVPETDPGFYEQIINRENYPIGLDYEVRVKARNAVGYGEEAKKVIKVIFKPS